MWVGRPQAAAAHYGGACTRVYGGGPFFPFSSLVFSSPFLLLLHIFPCSLHGKVISVRLVPSDSQRSEGTEPRDKTRGRKEASIEWRAAAIAVLFVASSGGGHTRGGVGGMPRGALHALEDSSTTEETAKEQKKNRNNHPLPSVFSDPLPPGSVHASH